MGRDIALKCGEASPPNARGWRTFLTVDDEPAHYCPACAAREFDDDETGDADPSP